MSAVVAAVVAALKRYQADHGQLWCAIMVGWRTVGGCVYLLCERALQLGSQPGGVLQGRWSAGQLDIWFEGCLHVGVSALQMGSQLGGCFHAAMCASEGLTFRPPPTATLPSFSIVSMLQLKPIQPCCSTRPFMAK